MIGVSRWTIHCRVAEYGLDDMRGFDNFVTDEELDQTIQGYISNHGSATCYSSIAGFFKANGLQVQRRRIRERLAKFDPQNAVFR